MSSIRGILSAGASLLLITGCTATQGTSAAAFESATPRAEMADSLGAHGAAAGFLAAFDSLQWEEFRGYFADEVTMFFPFPDARFAARADGRAAVEAVFSQFFDAQRTARTRAGRPLVQGISPRDLRVQMAGPTAAVVSFHLGAEASPARRSLVLRRTPSGEWKIIHWHASSAPQAAPREGG